MPAISKIRFTNVVYEGGDKRYNDELFLFDGHNSAIVLENGGGKTVFIQTAIQAIIPHAQVADRKMKDTLRLDEGPAHIAIEWILNEKPRRYALTCVTLFMTKDGLDSLKYVYEYSTGDRNSIENLPFVREKRPAERGEMQDYYSQMTSRQMNAHTFDTKKSYVDYLEKTFHIISSEWESIVKINAGEGDVERFFDNCRTTGQLVDQLLIPTIEDAIAGFDASKFADNFESQLSSFQEYKQFQDKLEEYRKIQERLDNLTNHFEFLNQKKLAYEQYKMKAKTYHLISGREKENYEAKRKEVSLVLEQLDKDQQALHHREKSLQVAEEREKLKEFEAELLQAQGELQTAEEKLTTATHELAHIKLANLRDRKDTYVARIEQLELELAGDSTTEKDDLLFRFEETKQQLADAFSKRKETILQELKDLDMKRRQQHNRFEQEENIINEIQSNINGIRENERGQSAIISRLSEEMESIVNELPINITHISMEDQKKQWANEYSKLDQQVIDLKNKNIVINESSERIGIQQEELQNSLQAVGAKLAQKETILQQIVDEEELLLHRLKDLLVAFSHIHSIYERQDSIEKSLTEEIYQQQKKLETLLSQERIATRFADDYKEQEIFFADSFLEKQLVGLRGQFDFLQTGIGFVNSSGIDVASTYPFWPMTVVTKNEDAPLLRNKLIHFNNELHFPIRVLTLDDATTIIKGEYIPDPDWILPAHWTTSLDTNAFNDWKDKAQEKAQTTMEARKNFNLELDQWKSLQEAFQKYIHRYPLNYKQELENDKKQLGLEQFQMNQTLSKNNKLLSKNKDELEKTRTLIEKNNNEMLGLASYMEKAQSYISKMREKIDREKVVVHYKQELSAYNRKLQYAKRDLEDIQEEIKEINDLIQATKSLLITEVSSHRLYDQVINLQPLKNEHSISVLSEIYDQLHTQVIGVIREQENLERDLSESRKILGEIKQDIHQTHLEHPDLPERNFVPLNSSERSEVLTTQISYLKVEKGKLELKVRNRKETFDTQQGTLNARINDVENPIEFHQPLEFEKQELKMAWKGLRYSVDSANLDYEEAEKQAGRWFENMQSLQNGAMIHQYLLPEIELMSFSEKDSLDFTYESERIISGILMNLERAGNVYINETGRVEKERKDYIDFCRSTISDSRLQQTTVEGIEARHSYEEVLQYKQLLEKRLHTATQYAEQHIQSRDKELELFISHMSTHVMALRTELEIIPKKTRVKIENGWRQIFSFNIPEWKENEGKIMLRDHVTWILTQLDSPDYQTDDGIPDQGKIKNRLERWLNSRQLLQVVLQNKPIRVTCHKVTNDNKISRAAFSWEESNSWSGGEKWSKNMSLFLGLLNYVAEKKQHIQPNMKRHRSVILDNPFGKASSGHVLTPVFFIAEQLGFQLITLTAHAEGKFLSDYFPVVYSCRLRQAAGTHKQIMTTKKTIQSAFFQDKEPEALERLNQIEQIDLFEMIEK